MQAFEEGRNLGKKPMPHSGLFNTNFRGGKCRRDCHSRIRLDSHIHRHSGSASLGTVLLSHEMYRTLLLLLSLSGNSKTCEHYCKAYNSPYHLSLPSMACDVLCTEYHSNWLIHVVVLNLPYSIMEVLAVNNKDGSCVPACMMSLDKNPTDTWSWWQGWDPGA